MFNFKSGQKITFSYVTREIIWKINMQELWFLCMTCCLNVLYKCMKFGWNTSNGYQVIEQKWNSIANDQREITQKISKAELWFLCMACCLNVLYNCMKFPWNISKGFQVIERTWFCDGQMFLQLDTTWVLTVLEKFGNFVGPFVSTHRQTDARGKKYVSWPFQGGDIITLNSLFF